MQLDMFSIIVITAVVLVGGYAVYIQLKTKKNGIETEALVTDVRESWDNGGDNASLSYTYTVEYVNFDGKIVSAALGGLTESDKGLSDGDRIVIKYLKDKQDYPILVRKIQ